MNRPFGFKYDDGAPILIYVNDASDEERAVKVEIEVSVTFHIPKIPDTNVVKHLKRNGGRVTDALTAHFHLSTSILSRKGPILRPAWVTDCTDRKKLLPFYAYYREPQFNRHQRLSNKQRDLAELVKALSRYEAGQAFAKLHRTVTYSFFDPMLAQFPVIVSAQNDKAMEISIRNAEGWN
jgi:hypothetical protein